MASRDAVSGINTNPMVFEELASSLATLASYARGDMETPFHDLEHLYKRALQEPPNYNEITALTGQGQQSSDQQQARAAWLLMNIEGLDVLSVHTRIWHKVAGKYSAPILGQVSRVVGAEPELSEEGIRDLGVERCMFDVLAVKEDAIWIVQVLTSDRVVDSALDRVTKNSGKLFRSNVYENPVLDGMQLQSLAAGYRQMSLAFPKTEVATLVLVLHPTLPDFELYQVELPSRIPNSITLKEGQIRKNSIDYADKLDADRDALYALPKLLDSPLFVGLPPCRGGRSLLMLAAAARRQLEADSLLTWGQQDFIRMLKDDANYDIERDKLRHDLDDRLVAQGFFRKWGADYYVSMRGIARYQYCLAKFTNQGQEEFDLDWCIVQRDRILKRFGCLN